MSAVEKHVGKIGVACRQAEHISRVKAIAKTNRWDLRKANSGFRLFSSTTHGCCLLQFHIYIYTSYYSPIFLDQDALNLRSSHSFPWLIYRGYPMILIVHWGEKFFACWFVLCQYGQWLLLLLSFSPFSLPGCSPSIPVTISMLSHVSAGRSLPNFTLYWHPILGGGNPKSKTKKIYTHISYIRIIYFSCRSLRQSVHL